MKIKTFLFGTLFALVTTFAGAAETNTAKATDTQFSPQQTQAIEKVIHDYLVNNPEVLLEATQALQAKQAEQMQSAALTAIGENKKDLFANPQSPIAGNPKGNIIMVEFFDYQCSHCRAMTPIVDSLIKKNPNLKVVFKELPIFGDNSSYAAQATLASNKQNKYYDFHEALFRNDGPLSSDKVLEIAKSEGIDISQLSQDMKDKVVSDQIENNLHLAQALRLPGTPAFVFSNKDMTQFKFVPGATSEQDLQQQIDSLNGISKTQKAPAN